MHNALLSLDPLRDSQMWKAVNAQIAPLRQGRDVAVHRTGHASQGRSSFSVLQATAFVEAVLTASGSGSSGPRVPEVAVVIDLETLMGTATDSGIVCDTDEGTALPVSTVRRLSRDAHVIPLVPGSNSVVLDQGRRVRTTPAEQRSAIA